MLTASLFGQTSRPSNIVTTDPTKTNVLTGQVQVPNAGTFNNLNQPNEYLQSLLNGCTPSNQYTGINGAEGTTTDALTGCSIAPIGSLVTQTNAVAGYGATNTASTLALGGSFQGRVLVNGAGAFGINSVAMDAAGLTSNVFLQHEFDTLPQNASSVYIGGGVVSTLVAPQSGTFPMQGFVANATRLGLWDVGFACGTASVANGCFKTNSQGIATNSSGNFGSNAIDINSNYWTGAASAYDTFQFVSSLPADSPPTFANFNLFHPSGVSIANFLVGINTAPINEYVSGNQIVQGALEAAGTAATLTGTGACATIITQSGGLWAGSAKCTGTTGASTLTITPGPTAPNGWVCNVQDETTRANLFRQTSHSTTACTLTITSVTQNDVFVFSAIAF
jgi:hypothetical protein